MSVTETSCVAVSLFIYIMKFIHVFPAQHSFRFTYSAWCYIKRLFWYTKRCSCHFRSSNLISLKYEISIDNVHNVFYIKGLWNIKVYMVSWYFVLPVTQLKLSYWFTYMFIHCIVIVKLHCVKIRWHMPICGLIDVNAIYLIWK